MSNQIHRIRQSISPEQWTYIPSKQNPADYGSRKCRDKSSGISPERSTGACFGKCFDNFSSLHLLFRVAAHLSHMASMQDSYAEEQEKARKVVIKSVYHEAHAEEMHHHHVAATETWIQSSTMMDSLYLALCSSQEEPHNFWRKMRSEYTLQMCHLPKTSEYDGTSADDAADSSPIHLCWPWHLWTLGGVCTMHKGSYVNSKR